MVNVQKETLNKINSEINQISNSYNESLLSLAEVTEKLVKSLDDTRSSIKRDIFELPDETNQHLNKMRGVIEEQIAAIGQLNLLISEIHGFNLCEPETSYNFFKESSKLFSPYELLNNEKITKSKKLLIESNPINTKTGFATVFDSRCFHSALPIYQHTRVSMDLRLIDKKYLNSPYPSFTGRGRKKAKFDTKNFYTEI